MTRKMRRVTPVHIRRCWKGVLVSGTAISGIKGVKGFTRSRKRTVGRRELANNVSSQRDFVSVFNGQLLEAHIMWHTSLEMTTATNLSSVARLIACRETYSRS